jgi:hypothetical protein
MTAFSWLVSFGLVAAPAHIVNFDHAQLGKVPPGWTVAVTNPGAPAEWEIRKDPSAPTQPYVFAQLSVDPRLDRFPLAIFETRPVRDADISVRVKPVSGRETRSGGLVFRYRDDRNYYAVRANAADGNVAIYKVENGQRIPIAPRGLPPTASGVKHDIRPNAWQILKVSVRGNRFQVYVNHRRILEAEDSTFNSPGKVGLCTIGDSVTYFDDFRLYPK